MIIFYLGFASSCIQMQIAIRLKKMQPDAQWDFPKCQNRLSACQNSMGVEINESSASIFLRHFGKSHQAPICISRYLNTFENLFSCPSVSQNQTSLSPTCFLFTNQKRKIKFLSFLTSNRFLIFFLNELVVMKTIFFLHLLAKLKPKTKAKVFSDAEMERAHIWKT